MTATMTEDVHLFETGAVRSTDADDTRYDLISPIGLEEVARTYAEGAAKYGDHNWLKGMPVSDLLNHAIRHIFKFLGGDRSEPHLPHAAWGLLAAIHSDKLWPELNENLLGPDCTPPAPQEEDSADEEEPAWVINWEDVLKRGDSQNPGWVINSDARYADTWERALKREMLRRNIDTILGNDAPPEPTTKPTLRLIGTEPTTRPAHKIPAVDDHVHHRTAPPVLYLSGPMTGLPDFNFPAFNEAAEKLRQKGYPVLNPADFGAKETSWSKNLERDLLMLTHAEVVVQLPGWENSKGASLEFSNARALGKGVVRLSELLDLP